MAKQSGTTRGRKSSVKGPRKVQKDNKKAIRRLIVALITGGVLFFAVFRLGIFGITAYNVIRFFVGSLAYPVMIAVLIYLFFIKWLSKQDGLVGGFAILLIGLLLEWHAYLFALEPFRDKEVFLTTGQLLMNDLLGFKVSNFVGGGMLGALFYKPVAFLFSNLGVYLIGLLFIILGAFLMSPWTVDDLTEKLSDSYHKWQYQLEEGYQKRQAKREKRRLLALEKKAEQEVLDSLGDVEPFSDHLVADSDSLVPERPVEIISHHQEEEIYDIDQLLKSDRLKAEEIETDRVMATPSRPKNHIKTEMLQYRLPSIELFAPDRPKNQTREKDLVRKNIRVLEDTFKSFGIEVKVERAEIGPSVTKYEIKPAVGVRVNRIANLADDLALALAAKDVRIEAPIPGKSLIGIEVPNSEIATVSFRELWEQSDNKSEHLLEIPLGKAVNGIARSFDLTRMPHLLVAGSTGSGKSVAVNGIISSILMKARPDQVKFMMIDPKMVELSVYNDIPHLLIPVVTNPRKASKALQKVVQEMENRYERFSHFGVRNITGYNAKVAEFNATSQEKQIPLPLIVVIVDELADLMMVASKEVEDAIIRLGQKARAAGIHMILATQRPSVDVISGLIKANVPSRIAFAVSSGTDSRTILDENGAEKLLGRGDMLFKPIDENHPIRLQGSFISDDDVERIVSFIKQQAEADYDDTFDPGEVSDGDDGSSGGVDTEGDPLFEEARAIVLETQKASASMLQRRLSVGFNRATRLMEELEEAGVIGPAEGTKPRKVLER